MKKKNFCIAGIFIILFLILIVLLKTVDCAPLGAAGTTIGLSTINAGFHNLTGVSMIMYNLTYVLGWVSFVAAGIFGIMGLVQWIQRKHLLKVDREILVLGILFIVVLLIYAFFEIVIVNYRPIIMPGETEPDASFPSSHTMMTISVLGSIFMIVGKYVKSAGLCKAIKIAAFIVMAAMLIGRLICGVHWLTDIAGAVLISAGLLALYDAFKC